MTQLQKEIRELEQMIEYVGWELAYGYYDGNPEEFIDTLSSLIEITDNKRKQQEATFQQMPWLRKAANR